MKCIKRFELTEEDILQAISNYLNNGFEDGEEEFDIELQYTCNESSCVKVFSAVAIKK